MRQTVKSLRSRSGHNVQGRALRVAESVARRMRIAASRGALWLLNGAKDFDGNTEADEAEAFEGVGFASRPSAGSNSEAITLKIGGSSGHSVIIATRDRDKLKVLIDGEGLEENETAIFNGESMVKIAADGTISIGSIGGVRQALATKADIDALAAWAASHIHVTTATIGAGATPGVLSPSASPVPAAACTQKLEAE